jgi:excinuclease ABC subunit C
VGSYFVPSTDLGFPKQNLLEEVHTFDFLTCEGEWEALLTENRLIKDIKPKYNARLVDDKTFPYLVVTTREDYPRVFVTRNPSGIDDKTGEKDPLFNNARVFGPFTNAGALREAVQVLQRVFRFRTCKLDIVAGDPEEQALPPVPARERSGSAPRRATRASASRPTARTSTGSCSSWAPSGRRCSAR